MKFKIATPERIMLETDVDSVTLPTTMGEITILPNHIPLVSNLAAGEVRYTHQGKQDFFAVSGGVIEIRANKEIIVLADTAEFGHEIDLQRAEEARDRAQKMMANADDKTHAATSAILQKHLARINIARKHRSHSHQKLDS